MDVILLFALFNYFLLILSEWNAFFFALYSFLYYFTSVKQLLFSKLGFNSTCLLIRKLKYMIMCTGPTNEKCWNRDYVPDHGMGTIFMCGPMNLDPLAAIGSFGSERGARHVRSYDEYGVDPHTTNQG